MSKSRPSTETERIFVRTSVAASILGLWTSVHYCYFYWFLSGDVTNVATVWGGYRQYGWKFLYSFTYTPDNWLLSLILPEFVALSLFKPGPTGLVLFGWFIFVGCVAMTVLIAYRLGGRWAALGLAPVLLLASQGAMGNVGSYGQPVSHNISLLWGLAVTYAGMRWLAKRSTVSLALATVGLFAAALSDPWTNAAFSLPIMLAGLGLAALPGPWAERRAALILAASAFAATWLAEIRLFGLLSFLPVAHLTFADMPTVLRNIRLLGAILTALFDMLPGHNSQTYQVEMSGPFVIILMSVVLAVISLATLAAWAVRFRAQSLAVRFAVAVAILSILGTIGAVCLTSFASGLWAGRYLMNVGFLLPLLVATATVQLGSRWGWTPRYAALTAGVLLSLAGAVSDVNAWWRGLPSSDSSSFKTLNAFLSGQGLTYGYGSYTGSNATTFTWLSRGRVTMRPVQIDPDTGRVSPWLWDSSPLWFLPADQPAGEDRTFLAFDHDCPEPDICVAGAIKQFGAPERVLTFRDTKVLVWPHRLTFPAP